MKNFIPNTLMLSASLRLFVASLLLVMPWVNPTATGPSPAVLPLLFSATCAAIFWILIALNPASRRLWLHAAGLSWLIAGLISSCIGLLQYFGAASEFSSFINPTRYGEAFANLRQRNQFATLTNISLAALIWLILQTQASSNDTKRKTVRHVLLPLMAAGLLAVGNATSSSRTGLFELLLICALCSCWGLWRHAMVRWVLVWAVLVYGVAAFAIPYLAGLDLSEFGVAARLANDEACGSRLILWSNVLHLIAQKPWLGWGWGELDYAHFITLYNEPRFCDILDNAHNLPLHLAVELGLPFALLVCGGFAWWAMRQKPWAERDAARQMAWAVMAVILLHSMLEYPLWYGPFQMAFGLCVLLLWRQSQPLAPENNSKKVSNWPLAIDFRGRAAIISVAGALLLSAAYAAWDYHRISQIYLEPESRSSAYRTDTLNKIRSSWLFADQVQFAELLVTPLTPGNAVWTFNSARQLLHYSPEPRVIEKLIESAVLLGKDDDALAYLARYRAAFPKEHALWAESNAMPIAKPN